MARAKGTPRVYSIVTIDENAIGEPFPKITCMSEPEALAWVANNEDVKAVIFEGVQFVADTHVTLRPVDAPTSSPVSKKRHRRTKAEIEAAKKVEPVKGANGAGEKGEVRS